MAGFKLKYYNAYCPKCKKVTQKGEMSAVALARLKCEKCGDWIDVVSTSVHKLTGTLGSTYVPTMEDRNAGD